MKTFLSTIPSPGCLAFDLDGTLAPVGETIDQEMVSLLVQIIEKTSLSLAFVTGSSLERSLWPRVALPLWMARPEVSFFERMFFFGDGGAGSVRLGPGAKEPSKILDGPCRAYMDTYCFSPDIYDVLPPLQEKLDTFLIPYKSAISQPHSIPMEGGWSIEPVEAHSDDGQEVAKEAVRLIEKAGNQAGCPTKAVFNLWGGRLEVMGPWDGPNLLSLVEKFSLAYPRVGMRSLMGIPTQILIKPVSPFFEFDMRQKILAEALPSILLELGLQNTHAFPAGRTAIDILKSGCDKQTALQSLHRRLNQPILYFGDEFLQGNDGAALKVDQVFGISVKPEEEREGPKLHWFGRGEAGVKTVVKTFLEP